MHVRTPSVLLAILLAGCGGVASTVPASDEATSRVDERLLGFWRVDTTATPDAKNEGILVVGRHEGSDKTLDLVTVSFNRDHRIEVDRASSSRRRSRSRSTRVCASPGRAPQRQGCGDGRRDRREGRRAGQGRLVPAPVHDARRRHPARPRHVGEGDGRRRTRGEGPGPHRRVQERGVRGADAQRHATGDDPGATRLPRSRGEAVFKADKPLVLRRLSVR